VKCCRHCVYLIMLLVACDLQDHVHWSATMSLTWPPPAAASVAAVAASDQRRVIIILSVLLHTGPLLSHSEWVPSRCAMLLLLLRHARTHTHPVGARRRAPLTWCFSACVHTPTTDDRTLAPTDRPYLLSVRPSVRPLCSSHVYRHATDEPDTTE